MSIEVSDTSANRHKLIIYRQKRKVIYLSIHSSQEERDFALRFLTYVANAIGDVKYFLRGQFRVRKNKPLDWNTITMYRNGQKEPKTYCYREFIQHDSSQTNP